tara:strand:+ start:79 stop:798 length:720 start_codon:yes stop_codon:yes gene_type:complete
MKIQNTPPFWGTIFIAGEIITSSDPSAFIKLSSADSGKRLMFDRRLDDFVYYDAILFNAHYNDGLQIEVQVNPEFKSYEEAKTIALKYAKPIGQLTTALRKDVKTVWIHKGNNLFGGGNNNLLIHTEQGDEYIKDGILEETLVHEAVHTSIDPYYAKDPLWIEAQKADGKFISNYAMDYPEREDLAESYLPYFAVRYRRERISQDLTDTILKTIPHRIKYFDDLKLDMHPVKDFPTWSY